jgi:hypothetical protein
MVQFECGRETINLFSTVILRAVCTSARFLQRASRREGACVFRYLIDQVKHKISQGYPPAGENAGSLPPFEMTFPETTLLRKAETVLLPSFTN